MTLSVSIRLISARMEGGRAGVILASNQNLSMLQKEKPLGQTPTMRGRERDTVRGGEREGQIESVETH